ncbi:MULTISPECIES: alpha/beta fold hydrolase [Burkholderia]|uniref:alpha/beta fold hydrolase n=1 Tax=Burkholderia TaxID=32008 RepID=UPI000398D563|nr:MULTISPECIES: alpha/beta fold hydrolase [Burkholderia]ERJ37734.1 putative exported protein [Burkholderia sp. AU4i]MBA9948845.1 alpha/beta fold hydrolase [Burkholderia cepacia]MBA9979131.1 alpha/beta fold hydrolase [Burkholderia cepacia]MBA9997815.1 alpha/beta fold hydrolase [Burkholderia cepacia]MBB0005860.1 alpha/beta fold hydrolase [Burkholderia cepacia]
MKPLALAGMGSYTVGGRPVVVDGRERQTVSLSAGLAGIEYDPNGRYWIEQAYVQYFVPHARRFELPLVLIHGGGLTGSSWETTPDGRPGWLHAFLAAGFEVHVVDNAERGRAGFCALPGQWAGEPIVRSEEESWSLYRIGDAADYGRRMPFAGQRFPVAFLDELTRRTVPRWLGTVDAQRRALTALIKRIGPCVLLGHSQGGGFALELAARWPDLVQCVVALEPHGDFASIGATPLDGRRALAVFGDFIERSALWRNLLGNAQAALHAWRGAGGTADALWLRDEGLVGHSHMMMMDAGSELIAARIAGWLAGAAR